MRSARRNKKVFLRERREGGRGKTEGRKEGREGGKKGRKEGRKEGRKGGREDVWK